MAIELMMGSVRADLSALGVNHDVFFSERSLRAIMPTRSQDDRVAARERLCL